MRFVYLILILLHHYYLSYYKDHLEVFYHIQFPYQQLQSQTLLVLLNQL